MLKSIAVRGFKSLVEVPPIELGALTLIFGPNAVGKSNLLDALQILSRVATADTVGDALAAPVRGLPLEMFTFPADGLAGLIRGSRDNGSSKPTFSIEVDATASPRYRFRYAVEVGISPSSGSITSERELLQPLTLRTGRAQGKPAIETFADGRARVLGRQARWRYREAPANYTQLSDRRWAYPPIEAARQELSSFRTYYLDPRIAMRAAQPPQEVEDIGVLGEFIAPFLYRLREEHPESFAAVRRTLRTIIPSVEDLSVDLDSKRGVLDLEVRQNGTPFSSRILSEGTLRVLGLVCVAVNPWRGSLIAFEEPENGVHPRRVELIAEMLGSLAYGKAAKRQVILTTHSPLFCGSILRMAKDREEDIRIYRAVQREGKSEFSRLDPAGPLFEDVEIRRGLSTPEEERIFEELAIRGVFDAP
jgi:predicted ATPase